MSAFALSTLAGVALVVIAGGLLRSGAFAIFRGVILAVYGLVAVGVAERLSVVAPLHHYLHAAVFVQSLLLIRPRPMPLWYRALVSLPAQAFAAGTLLAWPWALIGALGLDLPWVGLPYAAAAIGLYQSLTARGEVVDVTVRDGHVVDGVARVRPGGRSDRPLRVVQITDPHLGPFMSVARLSRICARAVAQQPDLVMLTGDFLTMESQADQALLRDALAPLAAMPGRVFACFGNHDHEAPDTVKRALAHNGVRLLVDDSVVVETAAGTVQIVGMDFVWRGRHEHLSRVCREHPRRSGALRILLLHDPGAFSRVPEGEADLVLSGHTHGGQIGLVSLGLPVTVLSVFAKIPDHGFWGRGADRLYVHRGTGHYGFPLRVGVPAEESVLRVHLGDAP